MSARDEVSSGSGQEHRTGQGDVFRTATAEVLRARGLDVTFGSTRALTAVDLTVNAGQVVALLGPSGSGKSTLLNVIAGLVPPSGGVLWLAGRPMTEGGRVVPPERRPVGMVFQNFALWPHLTVLETVAYPMLRAGRSRADARRAATELLRRMGVDHLADRRPAELSGGEQQRTGLARALARDAQLYLLDEPTAHLDSHLRSAFTETVLDRQRESGAAVLYSTHDAAEALALADRVVLLVGGRVVQVGRPQEVYSAPVSSAAAALTGRFSLLTGRVDAVQPGELKVELGGVLVAARSMVSPPVGSSVSVLVRPDWVELSGPMVGVVNGVAFRGPRTEYRVQGPAGTVLIEQSGPPRLRPGSPVNWGVRRARVLADADGSDLPGPVSA